MYSLVYYKYVRCYGMMASVVSGERRDGATTLVLAHFELDDDDDVCVRWHHGLMMRNSERTRNVGQSYGSSGWKC